MITSTYTCDVCGHEQVVKSFMEATDFLQLRIDYRFIAVQSNYSPWTQHTERICCRECAHKLGVIPIHRPAYQPAPEVSFLDKMRSLIRDVIEEDK